tara:strand:+ start:541 stop:834 length:294 start_codon:yes stop_codon:yes gene_type:complete
MDKQMADDVTNSPEDWQDFWENEAKPDKPDWDKLIQETFDMLANHNPPQLDMMAYWLGTLYEPTGEKKHHLWNNEGYMREIHEAMNTTFQGAGCCKQ